MRFALSDQAKCRLVPLFGTESLWWLGLLGPVVAVALAVYNRRRQRPKLVVRFGGGGGCSGKVDFYVWVGNEGPTIARDVVVTGYLDDEPVGELGPFDVKPNSPSEMRGRIFLERPGQAELRPGTGQPNLYGRTLTVVARAANTRQSADATFTAF